MDKSHPVRVFRRAALKALSDAGEPDPHVIPYGQDPPKRSDGVFAFPVVLFGLGDLSLVGRKFSRGGGPVPTGPPSAEVTGEFFARTYEQAVDLAEKVAEILYDRNALASRVIKGGDAPLVDADAVKQYGGRVYRRIQTYQIFATLDPEEGG